MEIKEMLTIFIISRFIDIQKNIVHIFSIKHDEIINILPLCKVKLRQLFLTRSP